jgi:anion-transporting  ArsA/GET3 family ATPase
MAREMDAAAALAQFARQHRPTLARIADRGTFLDQSDIKELLDLSLPGMDEVMALLELSESDRVGNFSALSLIPRPPVTRHAYCCACGVCSLDWRT